MKQLLIGAAVVALAVAPLAAQGNGHGKGQSGAEAKPNMARRCRPHRCTARR
jgi:hypothetical protein